MVDPNLEPRIRAWLHSLANITNPGADPVTAERIATNAMMLAKDGFTAGAFTSTSLHAVAQDQRFFPAYSDIRKALQAWWNQNKPSVAPVLTGSASPGNGMDAMDRSWVAFWHKRRAEIWAEGYQMQRGSKSADLNNLEGLIRANSPKGWALISGVAENTQEPGSVRSQAEIEHVSNVLRATPHVAKSTIPEPKPEPMPDVTLKGEALQRSRSARGLISKIVPPTIDHVVERDQIAEDVSW